MFSFKISRRRNFAAPVTSLSQRIRRLGRLEQAEEAKAFIAQFCRENGRDDKFLKQRWSEISRSLKKYRYYEHTPDELVFGAKVAWRNHARCIGRLFWEGLEVRDCRTEPDEDAIIDHMTKHMLDAYSQGKIRSIITVFPAIRESNQPAYIESRQVTQYAGYLDRNSGMVIGDRQNVEATRIANSLGYRPHGDPSPFDVLPLIMRDRKDRRFIAHLPDECHQQVEIVHPEIERFKELNLKWYAVPCISNMIMTIGGIDYPCSPFNGFYMGTEVASRDFADPMRYDLLPEVAKVLGDNPTKEGTLLWQDRALTELNRAVLFSYKRKGIMMTDHHTASEHFRRFCQREHSSGRQISADWSWIVPPHASSYCEVYHMPMKDLNSVPNFYWNRSDDGLPLMPYYGDQERSRLARRIDDWKRRWKLWSRKP